MPVPQSSQIDFFVKTALDSAGFKGEYNNNLSNAITGFISDALKLFASQAQIIPGTPAIVDPISTSGVTTAPGQMLAAPAGGPDKTILKPLALARFRKEGLNGEMISNLAAAVAKIMGEAIKMFTSQVIMAPGITITGMVTIIPGRLI